MFSLYVPGQTIIVSPSFAFATASLIVENNIASNNDDGIHLYHSSSNNITNNIALNNYRGIYLYYSSSNTITNNTVSLNYYNGIYLEEESNNNIIANNTVSSNNDDGIYLKYSRNNIIASNTVSNNENGTYLEFSCSNTIANNTASSSNDDGIDLDDSSNNIIANNTVSSNNRDGISLVDSSNNIIANNTVSANNWCGIHLSDSSNNIIENNTVLNNGDGIELWDSSSNTIANNNASNNIVGIELWYFSNNNLIAKNTVSSNNEDGIDLRFSSNIIYLNNFIDNTDQVYSNASTNIWNSILPITYTYNGSQFMNYLGNYWSDYTGSDADGDGIGDTPYSIDGDKDYYPLMERFENYLKPVENQPPTASFTYSPENPVVNETITFNASSSYDPDGNITSYEWDFGDGNITKTTEEKINHSYSEAGSYEVTLTVKDDEGATNSTTKIITVYSGAIFDTGSPRNPYPSIMGTHKGTIKPNHTVIATKLYTYACEGTGLSLIHI